jgi:sterol desaturase/sphingolipid hydroxylase (fatty acid hydroxylase superfamily)
MKAEDFKYFIFLYLGVITVEAFFFLLKEGKSERIKDVLLNISAGLIGTVMTGLIIKAIALEILILVYQISPLKIPDNFVTLLICILLLDFVYYWAHRIGHNTSLGWASHIVHHSSKQFNFSVGLRQGVTQHAFGIFYVPLAFIGFSPEIILTAYIISAAFQFFSHNNYIKKMPDWVEYIFVTPAHHRVHHHCGKAAFGKNYGGILILWDRAFGTFINEDAIHSNEYGVANHPKSYNIITINFYHFNLLYKQIKEKKGMLGKLKKLIEYPT